MDEKREISMGEMQRLNESENCEKNFRGKEKRKNLKDDSRFSIAKKQQQNHHTRLLRFLPSIK